MFLLLLIFVGFFLFKLYHTIPRISDENLYFYLASLLARGILPYRDFFLAQMPGQILLYSIAMKIFGFNLTLFKLIPVVFSMGTAGILYLLFKEIDIEEGG